MIQYFICKRVEDDTNSSSKRKRDFDLSKTILFKNKSVGNLILRNQPTSMAFYNRFLNTFFFSFFIE